MVLAAIDAANAADPDAESNGRPVALVYSEQMSEELARRSPGASEHLQIASRGQHVERWKIARADYPDERAEGAVKHRCSDLDLRPSPKG